MTSSGGEGRGEGGGPEAQNSRPAPLIPTFSPTEVGFTRLRHFKSDRNRQQPISIGGEKEQAAANGKAKFLTCSSVRSLRWSVVAKTGLRELEKRSCPM